MKLRLVKVALAGFEQAQAPLDRSPCHAHLRVAAAQARQVVPSGFQQGSGVVEKVEVEIGLGHGPLDVGPGDRVLVQVRPNATSSGVEQVPGGHRFAPWGRAVITGRQRDLAIGIADSEKIDQKIDRAFSLTFFLLGALPLLAGHRSLPGGSHHRRQHGRSHQRRDRHTGAVSADELAGPIGPGLAPGEDRPAVE